MTAATITDYIEVMDPNVEVVVLTATDGETYTSKKFGSVRSFQATLNEDTGALSIPISGSVSGATVTLNCTGLSSQKVCLELRGKI